MKKYMLVYSCHFTWNQVTDFGQKSREHWVYTGFSQFHLRITVCMYFWREGILIVDSSWETNYLNYLWHYEIERNLLGVYNSKTKPNCFTVVVISRSKKYTLVLYVLVWLGNLEQSLEDEGIQLSALLDPEAILCHY